MRPIDADALIAKIHMMPDNTNRFSFAHLVEVYAPTIDAEPVRHGHWIAEEDDKREYYCSNCEFPAGLNAYGYHNMKDPYCRSCGSKMDEDFKEE